MDKHGQIDMLHGPIWNKLPRFALPIAATAILEQLFNASDVAVVGNFTGGLKTIAVAAVGVNSPVIGLVLNLFIGIAIGVNVVIATAAGRGDAEAVRRTVHTAVTMSVVCGGADRRRGRACRPGTARHDERPRRGASSCPHVSADIPAGYAGDTAV